MEEVYANSYRSDNQDGVMVEWSQNCIKIALSNRRLSTFRLIVLMTIDIEGPLMWLTRNIYALKTLYATNSSLSSVKEKMEWIFFILTFLFSVCFKFENILKVYIYLNGALDSKFGHCWRMKVVDLV